MYSINPYLKELDTGGQEYLLVLPDLVLDPLLEVEVLPAAEHPLISSLTTPLRPPTSSILTNKKLRTRVIEQGQAQIITFCYRQVLNFVFVYKCLNH